jgi:hypothetical protein
MISPTVDSLTIHACTSSLKGALYRFVAMLPRDICKTKHTDTHTEVSTFRWVCQLTEKLVLSVAMLPRDICRTHTHTHTYTHTGVSTFR